MVVDVLLANSSVLRFILWLPAIVVAVGLVGAVGILLGRAFMATVRESGFTFTFHVPYVENGWAKRAT